LLNYDTPENIATGKYEYDMVTGVSGGSINALAIAGWKKGDENNLVEWLTNAWRNLSTKNVFHLWSGMHPIEKGIFEETGVLDDAPLNDKMN
jgi:predicted acylesterase/phospholipase RssA